MEEILDATSISKTTIRRGGCIHHPLWKWRFLATNGRGWVNLLYINKLLRIILASPPDPPRWCMGGILTDEMVLSKTFIPLSLILKTKKGRIPTDKEWMVSEAATAPRSRCTTACSPLAAFKDGIINLLFDVKDNLDCKIMGKDESWTWE